jgi:DNA-binding transcriptional ArsR family regulator
MSRRSPDQDLIDELARWIDAPEQEKIQTNGHAKLNSGSSSAAPTDEQVIKKCRAAENAGKFSALFDRGDVHAYHGGDDSGADLALLRILAFWTQDGVQLERIFSSSALGRREKWRRRDDYRGRTILKALSDLGEVYKWPRERPRLLSSSLTSPVQDDDDDNSSADDGPEIVFFADLGEPKEREFLIEKIGVKGYPIVAFGAGGAAKSFAMLAAGIAIASASGVDEWLGLRVLEHGYVCYLDFELDVEEQHRRVRDLCMGMGMPIPKRLAYLSGVGISPESAFRAATKFVEDYEAKAVIIDSMGLAMQGDMDKSQEVLTFHANCVNPLRRAGATPLIVDHEGKLQPGEKHKDKSPHGSAFKAWAARSVLQFVFEEFREESSELDIRVRQSKANFTSRMDPIGVRFTFEEKKVTIGGYELPDEELVDEESRPVKERILAALRLEGATIKQLVQITGATEGTIRNKLSELRGEGLITDNGRKPATYELLSSSSPGTGEIDDDDDHDDNKPATVADLFADPPDWLSKELPLYHQAPERYIDALCSHVAAVVLEDPGRRTEVREEVERILQEGSQV